MNRSRNRNGKEENEKQEWEVKLVYFILYDIT